MAIYGSPETPSIPTPPGAEGLKLLSFDISDKGYSGKYGTPKAAVPSKTEETDLADKITRLKLAKFLDMQEQQVTEGIKEGIYPTGPAADIRASVFHGGISVPFTKTPVLGAASAMGSLYTPEKHRALVREKSHETEEIETFQSLLKQIRTPGKAGPASPRMFEKYKESLPDPERMGGKTALSVIEEKRRTLQNQGIILPKTAYQIEKELRTRVANGEKIPENHIKAIVDDYKKKEAAILKQPMPIVSGSQDQSAQELLEE